MLTHKPKTATDVLKRYIYTSGAYDSVYIYIRTTEHTGIGTLIFGACERVLVLHIYITMLQPYLTLSPMEELRHDTRTWSWHLWKLQCYSHTWSGACGRVTIVHPNMILAPVEESRWYTHTWSWRPWKSHNGTPIHDPGAPGRVTMVHPYMILAPVEESQWYTHTWSWRLWKSHDGTSIHDPAPVGESL